MYVSHDSDCVGPNAGDSVILKWMDHCLSAKLLSTLLQSRLDYGFVFLQSERDANGRCTSRLE